MLTRLIRPSRGVTRLATRCTASYSSLEQGSSAFPWRSAPPMETKPVWMELIKGVGYKLLYTRTFPSDADAQEFWDRFYEEGAAAAFRTVTDAIFHHRTLQRSDEESTAVADVPDLSRVVDNKLASFYEQALNDVKNNGQNIVYELLEVSPPRVPTMELLVGLHRDDPLAKRKACKRTKGLLNLDLFATMIPRDGLPEQELEETWEVVRSGADKLVLRVWVDITAKEKFYIVDDTTGETVQGSEEPQTNLHRLLLETSFYTDQWKNATEAEHEWQVVDLDDWLEGNSFYVVEDSERGKHNEVSEVDDDSRK